MTAKRGSTLATRFWDKVEKTDECWLWTGRVGSTGYGRITVTANGRAQDENAHRVSFRLAGHSTPPGFHVCHHCDTPLCVNPDHLFLGTNIENIADRDSKGRQSRGEGRPQSKLTEEAVMEIRRRYATGRQCQRYLARLFGVAQNTISHVVIRRTWKHVA